MRAETVEGLDDAFGEALARHVADPEPSVLVTRAPGARAAAEHLPQLVPPDYSGSLKSGSASISMTSIWAFCSLPA